MTGTPSDDAQVLVVSRALPVEVDDAGVWRPRPGGLSTAVLPGMVARRGVWLGGHTGVADPGPLAGTGLRVVPVSLPDGSRETLDGFATRALWPLLHDLTERPVVELALWEGYRRLNRVFADAIVDQLDTMESAPVVWIHDHELLLVPAMVREVRPDLRIGMFLHAPWPAPELFARLPWRRRILEGMLAADVITLQTERYRKNFARTCGRLLPEATVRDRDVVLPGDRTVRLHANPTSIDVPAMRSATTSPPVDAATSDLRQQFAGTRVLLGVDRQDYTKGILERLDAFERLLDTDPGLAEELTLVQIGVPSRTTVPEYQDLADELSGRVGRINGRYTRPGGSVPIHYLHRGVDRDQLLAYYRLADVLLVTSLKDGMNLVAKEYVVCQDAARGDGVLVLSEFAGAHDELAEAITCNPFDVDDLATRIATALDLGADDRVARLAAMAARVAEHDAAVWAGLELDRIAGDLAPTQVQ